MPPAELAFRLRQQVHKTMERVVASGPAGMPRLRCRLNQHAGSANSEGSSNSPMEGACLSPAQLQKAFQQRMPERFFAGVFTVASSKNMKDPVLEWTNLHSQRLIAGADAVRQGEFDLLAYGRLSFGKPVCCHLDPISGRLARSLHCRPFNPRHPNRERD